MKLSEIHIRDPFILPYEGKYYMYGTPGKYAWEGVGGFWCFVSDFPQEPGERTWKPQRVGPIPGIPAHSALWPLGPQALGATWLLHG